MDDLISRQALLKQIDIDSDGEPGYYGDTWKFIDTIKNMPSALSTNLAEVGTDCISRQAVLALPIYNEKNLYGNIIREYVDIEDVKQLPPIQPKLLQPWEVLVAQAVLPQPAEPKKGRWHYSDGKPARIGLSYGVICDQCGTESEYCTNFCGECGADMRGEQDG